MADLYKSVIGGAAVTGKAVGGIATGMGMYQGAKAVSRMLKRRRAKRLSKPSVPKPSSRKFKRSRGGSNSRSAIRRKDGLRFHETVDRSTGEIKPRWSRAEALKKASKSTKYGLRRFGGRRLRFR